MQKQRNYCEINRKAIYNGKNKVNLNNLDKYFVKSELIPAIVYEADTKTVLMLAYMNEESLRKTLETGYTWFWSRSRQEL